MDTIDAVMETPRIKVIKEIIKKLDKKNVNKLLDIGCGNGYITENVFMEYFDADFYGIEMGDGAEEAEKKGINTIKIDLNQNSKWIYDDNFFDLIFAGEIIEHLLNPDIFLEEIYRTLAINGVFIITTPNLAAWYNRVLLLLGYQPFGTDASFKYPYVGKLKKFEGDGQHLRVGTYKSIKELLEIHGFEIIYKKGTFAEDLKLLSVFRYIEKLTFNFPSMSTGLIFICKKRKE